jgi:hypothetical protein
MREGFIQTDQNPQLAEHINYYVATGPFDLAMGDTLQFSVAMIFGQDEAEVLENEATVDSLMDEEFTRTDREAASTPQAASALQPNYPNPFREQTTIEYALDQPGRVRLAVYDLLGRRVRTLVDERQSAGRHSMTFDAETLPGGVYVYRLTAPGGRQVTRKMTVVR